MSPNSSGDDLRALRNRLRRIRTSPPPANVESAKNKIVWPILIDLGWKHGDPCPALCVRRIAQEGNWEFEFTLKKNGRTVALVALTNQDHFEDYDRSLLLSHATREGVGTCAMTTGVDWHILVSLSGNSFEEREFVKINIMQEPLDDVVEKFRRGLHPEPVSGDAHVEPTEPPVAQQTEAGCNPSNTGTVNPDQPDLALSGDQRKMLFLSGIVLWGVRYEIRADLEILRIVVEKLHERNPTRLYDAMHLRDGCRPFVTTNPDDVTNHLRVNSTDLYVFCPQSSEAIQERARWFLNFFGYQGSDLQIDYF